jgi:[acyl-carrier-protein] S-malonyltransferase
MNSTALVFPGQGSQFVGMGKNIYQQFPEIHSWFKLADDVLGFKISDICFDGPELELNKTSITQPAILLISKVFFEIFKKHQWNFEAVSGHSLGIYSALVVAEAIKFEDALLLVQFRGQLMQEAGGQGKMAVILQLDIEKIKAVCQIASSVGVVEPANVNCPGQIVIAGESKALEMACQEAKKMGAKRVLELPVSGPFHSSLMKSAVLPFWDRLKKVSFSTPIKKVYSDTTGLILSSSDKIVENLAQQLTTPVQWINVIQEMVQDGYTKFVEVGPGKVLTGLIKKINAQVETINFNDMNS